MFSLPGEPLSLLFTLSRRVYDLRQRLFRCRERQWKSGIPPMDQDSKRFLLAKEFIRERNWIEGYSHDEWSFQCEYDSAMSQLLLFVSF